MIKISMLASAAGAAMLLLATAAPTSAATSSVTASFKGTDLTDNITVGGGFIPPDTMGAVGTTQFVSILNGSYSVFDKATGVRTSFIDDDVFWNNAGATGVAGSFTGGDPRILFNATAGRWVATAFGGDRSFLNIGVSDTADASGSWKATTFLGFNGAAGDGVADYATLAMDRNAVYVGTTDFDPGFEGSTLNVIPLADVFGAGAPVVSNRAIFLSRAPFATDLGYAQQGVMSQSGSSTGLVVADGILSNGVAFKVTNAALGSAGAAVSSRTDFAMQGDIKGNLLARQPDGSRTLDTLDSRLSSIAYEHNGKIYLTRTVTTAAQDYTVSRVTVLDASTFAVLQQFDIDDGNYDHYQSAIAVNGNGAVVSYNRSGFDAATGNITVMANAYTLDANGLLVFDAQHILKVSENNGYSLGASRNRWGDYAQVTIDPTDASKFWLIGEYANFRPSGSDGWSTWIGEITFAAVPEPATWGMMLAGFGLVGFAMRRQRLEALTV